MRSVCNQFMVAESQSLAVIRTLARGKKDMIENLN